MQSAHAALLRRRREPALMGRSRVGTDAEYIATSLAELRDPTAHGSQLGGSDEGKVARVKEQDEPPIEIVREGHLPRSRAGAIDAR